MKFRNFTETEHRGSAQATEHNAEFRIAFAFLNKLLCFNYLSVYVYRCRGTEIVTITFLIVYYKNR